MMQMVGLTEASHLWLYFVLVFGIVILPGMDMAFVMARALVDGRRGGAAAVAGIVAGGLIHVALSAIGIGLILKTAPQIFNAMLTAGAFYIAWMGWSLLRGASALGDVEIATSRTTMNTFGRAVLTCLLNPKAYVFMLAVFPQFLRPEYASLATQSMILGAITSLTQLSVYGAVALLAAEAATWLRCNKARQIYLGRLVGTMLIAAAVCTIIEGWRKT